MANTTTNHSYFTDLAGQPRNSPLTNNQLIGIIASNGSTAGLTEEERERLDSIANKADLVGGKVPESQLPSYIDSVQEFSNQAAFPATGADNVIYVDNANNTVFRWSGTTYVQLSSGLVIGETSSSAMRGDQGKIAYDHTLLVNNPHGVTKGQIGLGNVTNTSDAEKPVSTATAAALSAKANTSHVHTGSDITSGTIDGARLANATTSAPGAIQLSGDISGTATAPTIPKLDTKEPLVTGGSSSQFYRGDKTWVTLNKSNVGLDKVDNTSDAEKPVSSAQATALLMKENVITPANISNYYRGDKSWQTLDKAAVGLANVDNTSDASKPISVAQKAVNDSKADLVGGIVPTSQLPSYVDNVQEYANLAAFPATGMSNVVYLSIDTNKPYRWGGSSYVEISSAGIALGETSATAYRGDRGKTAYDHTSLANNPHSVTKAQVGLSNVDNTSDANKPINQAMLNAFSVKADLVDGKVPTSQLPTSTAGLELGTTSTTAGRGDHTATSFAHTGRTDNPHSVTKAQVGLSSVDNTSDLAKPLSTATTNALNTKVDFPAANSTIPLRNGSGAQSSAAYSSTVSNNSVPLRSSTGTIATAAPTSNEHATTKLYVDAANNLKLNKAGDTSTGTQTAPTFVATTDVRLGSSAGVSMRQGAGSPNGAVSAPVGSLYIDTSATNGAIDWKKTTGTSDTGWVVVDGDTGWRNISNLMSGYVSGSIRIKRSANTVSIVLADLNIGTATGSVLLTSNVAIAGFGFNLYTANFIIANGTSTTTRITASPDGIRLLSATSGASYTGYFEYHTTSGWPSTLPGVAA